MITKRPAVKAIISLWISDITQAAYMDLITSPGQELRAAEFLARAMDGKVTLETDDPTFIRVDLPNYRPPILVMSDKYRVWP